MKYTISIIAFLFSINVFAADTCLLKEKPNVQGCKINGIITSDASRPDSEKVWVCINYRKIDDSENQTNFIISGRVKAPTSRPDATERDQCELNIDRCTQAAGENPKDASCGDYKIHTSVQTKAEKTHTKEIDREGYRLDLVLETTELRTGASKFAGIGKSVCEIGFIETQLVESKKEESAPAVHWPDCR